MGVVRRQADHKLVRRESVVVEHGYNSITISKSCTRGSRVPETEKSNRVLRAAAPRVRRSVRSSAIPQACHGSNRRK
jgi:hypothetical protein